MIRASARFQLTHLLVGLVAVAALVLTGCGEEDLCADVSCEFGACDSATGQCINPSQCRLDNDCVPGYECGADYTCEAVEDCTADDECDAGVCQDGACVNPSSCASNDDCVERTFCGPGGTCEADPCNQVDCQRGVCQRGTDNCVSADSCTPQTESLDCVAGERCAEGSCAPAESFCDNISCERGECSFEAGGCVSAADCAGDDMLCAQGEFCNDQNQCQADLCEQNGVDCGDNGVCVPAAGACQNATSCGSNSDCTAGHLCVDGTCRLSSVACGDAGGDGGCPGNQLCEFDEDNLSAACTEPAQCETSFDCTGDRQCGGLTCLEPVSCQDDYFEPNDTADAATDFLLLAEGNTMSGSVCSSDSDFYFFDSTEFVDASMRGTLVVEVDVPARDRGLGQLEVELIDSSGATQDSSSGALGVNGKVRIEKAIGLTDHGEYTVVVRAADDLTDAGVRYDLSVNLLPNETVKACEDAVPLRVNQRVSGSTDESDSAFLGSSCTVDPNPSNEVVYSIELDAPQEVTFTLTPQLSATNLSMSLRSRCTQASSERACVNDSPAGRSETMSALLEAGTHYLVVQSPDASGGAFELVVDTIYTACAAADTYCEDQQIAQICTTTGGRFQSIDCDAGCNPSSGRCFPPEGDVCFSAPVIDVESDLEIQLAQLNNEYEMSDGGCLDDGATRTGGPEQTYQIELPAQTAVTAEVDFANEVEGALYLVENCGDADNTCVAGAAGSVEDYANQEILTYSNFTDDPVTLFLVVDTIAGQAVAEAALRITYDPITCVPDARQCDAAGDVEMCDVYGIDYRLEDECGDYPCSGGYCLTGATCAEAVPLGDGDTIEEFYDGGNAIDPYASGSYGTCNFATYDDTEGHDRTYQIDLKADEVLTATISDGPSSSWGASSSTMLYVMSDCNTNDSCIDNSKGSSAEVQYLATQDETVYVVVDRTVSSSTTSYSFQLDIDISPVECTAGVDTPQCKDSSTLEYCVEPGIYRDYTCDGGCANDACGTPTGNLCLDTVDVTSAASQSGGTTINGTWDDYDNLYESYSSCGVSDYRSDGEDFVYQVSLNAGETLSSSITSTGSVWPMLGIATGCPEVTSTCTDSATPYSTSASLSYTASTAETVYLIVDNDWPQSVGDTFTLDIEIQ